MKLPTLCAVICSLTVAVATQVLPSSPTNPEPDDYAIYSTVLDAAFAESKFEHLVIGDQTMMSLPPIMMGMTSFGDPLGQIRREVSQATLDDYDQKNKAPIALENKFSGRVPVVLVSSSDRDKIFRIKGEGEKRVGDPAGMKELQRLYPKSQGFMNLSRIGFNRDGSQALVYIGNVCGGLCGSGQFFLLSKEGGSWKIKLSSTSWIS